MTESPENITLFNLSTLQWQQFGKRSSNWFIVVLFLLAGVYGLYQGYAEKLKKLETIQLFRAEKDSLLQQMKTGITADTLQAAGKAAFIKSSALRSGLWSTRLPSYKLPVSTAIYNIGQSDVFTYYYLFAGENFEMQLFKQTEINNPLRALSGHFDVSFWIVYLLPLLALLFTFDALSREHDNGNWKLIASQGISEKTWLQSKFLVVGGITLFLLVAIAITGCCINAIAFKQAPGISDMLFFATAVVYLIFWLALYYFINSLRRPTTYNALVNGLAWILTCLVLPVLVSKASGTIIRVDNTAISTYSRRPQNTAIESSKAFAAGIIKKFAAQNQAYKNADADSANADLLLRTYHAWHWMLHEERWPVVQLYFAAVEKRQQVTNLSVAINPASSTDGFLTALADNDAAAYHGFINQTERLHTGLHDAFYPALFKGKTLTHGDYRKLPMFHYQRMPIPVLILMYYFLLTVVIFLLVSRANKIFKTIAD